MSKTKRQVQLLLASSLIWLAQTSGCATQTQLRDVGTVVEPERKPLATVPVIVQTTEPKPAGYFQNSFLDYFSPGSKKPTPSTTPTPAVGPTR